MNYIGKQLTIEYVVKSTDFATFGGETVHEVYSTFSIARDAEWTGRQLLLQIKAEDEEGVGTHVNIKHRGPAFEGETVEITATIANFEHGQLLCHFVAKVGERVIADGDTGQKILKKEKLNRLFRKN